MRKHSLETVASVYSTNHSPPSHRRQESQLLCAGKTSQPVSIRQTVKQCASQGNRWLQVMCEMTSLCRVYLSLLRRFRNTLIYGRTAAPPLWSNFGTCTEQTWDSFIRKTLSQADFTTDKSKQLFKMLINPLPGERK